MRTSREIEEELAAVVHLPASVRRARQAELRRELQEVTAAELAAIKAGPRGECRRVRPIGTPVIVENSGFRTTGYSFYEAEGHLDEDGEVWIWYPRSQSWEKQDASEWTL